MGTSFVIMATYQVFHKYTEILRYLIRCSIGIFDIKIDDNSDE